MNTLYLILGTGLSTVAVAALGINFLRRDYLKSLSYDAAIEYERVKLQLKSEKELEVENAILHQSVEDAYEQRKIDISILEDMQDVLAREQEENIRLQELNERLKTIASKAKPVSANKDLVAKALTEHGKKPKRKIRRNPATGELLHPSVKSFGSVLRSATFDAMTAPLAEFKGESFKPVPNMVKIQLNAREGSGYFFVTKKAERPPRATLVGLGLGRIEGSRVLDISLGKDENPTGKVRTKKYGSVARPRTSSN